MFDLTVPENSYILGLLQADGHHRTSTRNRGSISIEIKESDLELLEKLSSVLPVTSTITHRTRDTNFKKEASSAKLSVFDWHFRKTLLAAGLPIGKKSETIALPTEPFSEIDYFRGIIDGDGSVGITTAGLPFISLTMKSQAVAEAYRDYVHRVTGVLKVLKRNKRDQIYNIMVSCEGAQELVKQLYYHGCLGLARKIENAELVKAWVRPSSYKKVTWKKSKWAPEQDEYILTHTIQDSMKYLDRTKQSVSTRLWRVRKDLQTL